MEINFHNQNLTLKCGLREFMIYEKLNNGHIFTGEDAEEFIKLFYASVISALSYQPPVDEILDFVEKNEGLFVEFLTENFKES